MPAPLSACPGRHPLSAPGNASHSHPVTILCVPSTSELPAQLEHPPSPTAPRRVHLGSIPRTHGGDTARPPRPRRGEQCSASAAPVAATPASGHLSLELRSPSASCFSSPPAQGPSVRFWPGRRPGLCSACASGGRPRPACDSGPRTSAVTPTASQEERGSGGCRLLSHRLLSSAVTTCGCVPVGPLVGNGTRFQFLNP